MSFLSNLFGGTSGRTMQTERFEPGQAAAIDQILQMALSGLKDPTKGFEPIAQQARSQFEQQTIPSLAERFTSMGQGAQRSSGFQSALGRAGAGLEESLAAMKSKYGLQQQGLMQSLAGLGLTPKFESSYIPRQPGLLESFASQSVPNLLSLLF